MDYLNKILFFEERNVRIVGTNEDPWFCGRDVVNILDYKNTNKALIDNIDEEDRNTLENIVTQWPNFTQIRSFNKKELSTIYINKSGLNSLLTKSKFNNEKDYKKRDCLYSNDTISQNEKHIQGWLHLQHGKTFGRFKSCQNH